MIADRVQIFSDSQKNEALFHAMEALARKEGVEQMEIEVTGAGIEIIVRVKVAGPAGDARAARPFNYFTLESKHVLQLCCDVLVIYRKKKFARMADAQSGKNMATAAGNSARTQ